MASDGDLSEKIRQVSSELLPTGLLVIDQEARILFANDAFTRIFGYTKREIEHQNLSCLLQGGLEHHAMLVRDYLKNPSQYHQMASGRVVRGRHKDGSDIDIQINLSVHNVDDQQLTFATVNDFAAFSLGQHQTNEQFNRMNRAIKASNDGVWEWYITENKVWYSPQLKQLIGKPIEQDGKLEDWQDHVHPEDWPKVEKCLEDHLQGLCKYDISYRGLTAEKQYEWFHTRGDTVFDQNGKPVLMSGILSNIHKTKQLESRLEEQTRFLDEVLKRSLTGLYIFNLKTFKNIYINEEYTHLTGYLFEELEQIQSEGNLLTLFHPDDLAAVQAHFNDVMNDQLEEGVGIEYRFRHKDGSWRWFYSRDTVYSYDDTGQPYEILGSFFDITKLKSRERKIKELAVEYANTFEKAGVGISHVSKSGEFLKVNNKICEILGYSKEELLAKRFQDLTYEEDLDKSTQAMKDLLAGQIEVYEAEKRYIRKDGKMIWANLTVSLVSSPDHTREHFISIIEDITDRKEIEYNLHESNAALERFAYSASHDLQEPLRKISAFSGALNKRLEGKIDDPEARFQLNRIADSANRMGVMIDNLLELSRAASSPLHLETFQLEDLINVAVEDLSTLIKKSQTKISLLQGLAIRVDGNAFTQVLRNILKNSINYRSAERSPEIMIDAYTKGPTTLISIRDNGVGVPRDKAQLIFEPFRRLVGKIIPGTGMGLATCRQIIKAHNGKIYVNTDYTGGAEFVIELPKV